MSKIAVATRSAAAGELLPWDSEFFGVKMGRASGPDVDRWAVENMIGCVSLLVAADRPGEVQDAEQRGYRLTDVRVQLERATAPYASGVRHHRDDDVDALAAIARVSHRITRFYADPRFDNDRCDDLYEAWLRNSCAGWADRVLVADDRAGYVTVHIDSGVASIGLIAVDESRRGHGVGQRLVEGAVDFAHSQGVPRMTVGTQGRNLAAQRLFQRCGFVTCATGVWLHRWFDYPDVAA